MYDTSCCLASLPIDYNSPCGLTNDVDKEIFLPNLLITDEATFAMNGELNTQNVRQYTPKGHPPTFNFENL